MLPCTVLANERVNMVEIKLQRQQEAGLLRLTSLVKGLTDGQIYHYQLELTKHGQSGNSVSRQAGKVLAQGPQVHRIGNMGINIHPGDDCKLQVELKQHDELIYRAVFACTPKS